MDRYTRDARNMIDDVLRADLGVEALAALDAETLRKVEVMLGALRDRVACELAREYRAGVVDEQQRDSALAAVTERERKARRAKARR